MADRPLIKKVALVAPEHLVGDLIQSGHPLFGLVWVNPERVTGIPFFYGTRVPIKTLFDSLAAGQSMEEFLEDFEGVAQNKPKRCWSWLDLTCLMIFRIREDSDLCPSYSGR